MAGIQIPLKWVGGKRREIKYYEDWLKVDFDRYFEVFAGGLATYFYLNLSSDKELFINDLNPKLTQFYHDLAYNRERMIAELKTMENTPEFYYRMRDAFNGKIQSDYMQSSIFMYINKTAFSGMQRFNSKNEFNTPFGRYKNFHPWNFLTEEASELLRRTNILNEDFVDVFSRVRENDFVFLDPPYFSTFTEYTVQVETGENKFTEKQQEQLADLFKSCPAKCLLIISDMGPIRELYSGYIKGEYDKNYSINVKNRMKDVTEAKHLIIANYDI